jgi:hypothetical protein
MVAKVYGAGIQPGTGKWSVQGVIVDAKGKDVTTTGAPVVFTIP